MSKDDATGTEEGAPAPQRDASLRVDTNTLSSEEQDFARMMGFGGEENPPVAPPTRARTPEAPRTPAPKPLVTPAPSAPPVESAAPAAASPVEMPAAPTAPATAAREWEDIHPRAAALGRQTALVERADRVMKLEPDPAAAATRRSGDLGVREPGDEAAAWRERLRDREARIAALEASERELRDALAGRPAALARPAERLGPGRAANPDSEKEVEGLRNELEILLQERDRLGDELAIANSARSQAQTRADRFEAALRAARGPDGPLPDGERDLRAEVVGLRRRLDDASAETRRLREELEARATELAIANAHRDDRQQEIDQHKERITALEQDRTAQLERLDEALARQRDLLTLVTRVQAENVELRSAQAALEETLEARDLEINAREEHLQVTRRGLAARDQQLLDLEERLEKERHGQVALEAELDRARRATAELEDKLARRDARIASLSTTLTRIEQAIGRPVPAPASGANEREAAEPVRRDDREIAPRSAVKPEAKATPHSTTSPSQHASDTATGAIQLVATSPGAQPPILAAWRDAQLRAICGDAMVPSVAAFLAQRLSDHFAEAPPETLRITSLGGARVDAEIELVRALEALGTGPISVRVLDHSGNDIGARTAAIEAAGLATAITVETWDAARPPDGEPAHALLASDALFAESHPDRLLAQLEHGLAPNGVLLFVDRLAGGPIVLSPESQAKLAELWQVLPESWTERAAFASPPAAGDDGGTAISEVDLAAVLCESFAPVVTVGVGHIADLFVGPARGFALSQAGSAAEPLLASLDAIDESRSIVESLAPRHGVAVCVRRAEADGAQSAPRASLGLPWPGPGC